jgi:hypothetical protein
MTTKIEAKSGVSPDRGDARIGVVVQLNGYRVWLTMEEAEDLMGKVRHAVGISVIAGMGRK